MTAARRKRLLWILALGLAAGGGLALAFWPRPVPVDLASAVRGPMRVTIDEEGQTRVKDVYRVSAPVAGRVLRIEAEVGDPVIEGQTVLATMEATRPSFLDQRTRRQAEAEVKAAQAAFSLAEAEVERAAAELDFSRRDLERAMRLTPGQAIAERALDRAEIDVRVREAELATTRANLEVRASQLETARAALFEPDMAVEPDMAPQSGQTEPDPSAAALTNGARAAVLAGDAAAPPAAAVQIPPDGAAVRLRAPISGRVLQLHQKSEAVVAAGSPLLEIGDPQNLEAVVDLLSQDAVRIARGAPVLIEDWGGGQVLDGTVRRIEPFGFTKVSALGIEEQRVNVIIDFAEPIRADPARAGQALGHGYRIQTRIIAWQREGVLKLPLGALFRQPGAASDSNGDGDGWAVFLYQNGRAALAKVTIGRRNDQEAEILSGVEEGDRVILHPSDRIEDGVAITEREVEVLQ